MAEIIVASKQVSLSESTVIFDFDFTEDLRAGESVSSATATHYPPRGAAVVPTVGTVANDVVPVSLASLVVTGVHELDVLATLSGGRKSSLRLRFEVIY
jgi:hypothetical protein